MPERIIVAGFGRCGSTMLMQMLDVGGVPVHPCSAGYESDDVRTPEGWGRIVGAAKALHPFFPPAGSGPFASIWLDRDPREQTASMLKLSSAAFDHAPLTRNDRRRWITSLRRDRPKALRHLRGLGRVLTLSFEGVLAFPGLSARTIADFLEGPELDTRAMASVVDARDPRCAPDLSREMAARP